MKLAFTKMHGLGNDFVVLDFTERKVDLSSKLAKHIADRHFGVGCDQILIVEKPGFIDDYIARGRSGTPRDVTLRQAVPEDSILYGTESDWVQSEALLKLNLGEGRLPGLLAMGSEDPHQFAPSQGTDLLTFFAGTFERAMRRWLS